MFMLRPHGHCDRLTLICSFINCRLFNDAASTSQTIYEYEYWRGHSSRESYGVRKGHGKGGGDRNRPPITLYSVNLGHTAHSVLVSLNSHYVVKQWTFFLRQ
jgi:hypothetical protein